MSLSVQCSVVESFSFNRKKVQSVHVKREECLVSRDVYKAIGYEEENGKKAIQNLVQAAFWRRAALAKPGGKYFPAAQRYGLVKRTWALLLSIKMQ